MIALIGELGEHSYIMSGKTVAISKSILRRYEKIVTVKYVIGRKKLK